MSNSENTRQAKTHTSLQPLQWKWVISKVITKWSTPTRLESLWLSNIVAELLKDICFIAQGLSLAFGRKDNSLWTIWFKISLDPSAHAIH